MDFPGLIRTLKMMGTRRLTFAAIGGVYIGVEQVVQNYRAKRDFSNGDIGGLWLELMCLDIEVHDLSYSPLPCTFFTVLHRRISP